MFSENLSGWQLSCRQVMIVGNAPLPPPDVANLTAQAKQLSQSHTELTKRHDATEVILRQLLGKMATHFSRDLEDFKKHGSS